jgi:hypothetical protein
LAWPRACPPDPHNQKCDRAWIPNPQRGLGHHNPHRNERLPKKSPVRRFGRTEMTASPAQSNDSASRSVDGGTPFTHGCEYPRVCPTTSRILSHRRDPDATHQLRSPLSGFRSHWSGFHFGVTSDAAARGRLRSPELDGVPGRDPVHPRLRDLRMFPHPPT